MTDREKIVNDFEHEVNKAHGEGWDFVDLSTYDAKKILALLKEQEAVKPKKWVPKRQMLGTVRGWYCPKCDFSVSYGDRYCRNCGRGLKWDDGQ